MINLLFKGTKVRLSTELSNLQKLFPLEKCLRNAGLYHMSLVISVCKSIQ